MTMRSFLLLASLIGAPAAAQEARVDVVAIPQLATPANVNTSVGYTGNIARQVADVIASDLRQSREVVPLGPTGLKVYSSQEAAAPAFGEWRKTAAKALITGFVQARDDGRLTVACYLHDVAGGRELARQGVAVAPAEWRRAAHRCADMAYAKLSGRPGWFDTRIAYVAESGPRTARIKRIAMMDSDGTNHRYLTAGDAVVLSPRLAPGGERIAYVALSGGQAQLRLHTLTAGDGGNGSEDRVVSPPGTTMSFAPRFSPDGSRLAFSAALGGNTDILVTDVGGAGVARLTTSPGLDTAPSYSPDGSRIVFESDRSGTPQLYVMNADGSDQRRISFGGFRYGSPAWSPDGEWIAFTRTGGDGLRIGVMRATGADERMVTSGAGGQDEAPSWGAGSRSLLFQRSDASGRATLFQVAADGGEPRAIVTPQGGSDPDWSTGGTR
jgi:TolB protein